MTNDTTNNTRCSPDDYMIHMAVPERAFIGALAAGLSFLTVVGNIMVMISFKIDKQLQTISNYFLFSLAVADFTVGLISMPLFTVSTLLGYWPLGQHVCDAWLAVDYLASNASVLNLLIISFDRYFSVTRPLTYRAKRTTTRAAIMIAGAWGISLLLWPPWIYAWPYIEGKRTVPEGECYIQFIETNHYITFGTAIAAFYIPVSVMIVLYFRIWRETKKRQKDLPNLQAGLRSTTSQAGHDTALDKQSDEPPYERRRARCGWLRTWCINWWHSGREDDTDVEENGSEMGVFTPISVDTPMQPDFSRTTSFTVIREIPEPILPTTGETIVHHPDIHWPGPSTSTARSSSSARTTPIARIPRYTGFFACSKSTPTTPLCHTPTSSKSFPSTPSARRAISAPERSISPTDSELFSDEGSPIIPSLSLRATGEQVYAAIPHNGLYTVVISLPKKPLPPNATYEEIQQQASIELLHNEIPSLRRAEPEIEVTPPGMRKRQVNMALKDVGTSTIEDLDSIVPCPTPPIQGCSFLPDRIQYKLPQVMRSRSKKKKKKEKKPGEKKQDKKAAKTLTAILLSFIITWTPYNVLVLLKPMTTGYACIPPQLWDFFYYLCYINSTINPVCYALCNTSFRATYIRILTCRWKSRERVGVQRGGFNN